MAFDNEIMLSINSLYGFSKPIFIQSMMGEITSATNNIIDCGFQDKMLDIEVSMRGSWRYYIYYFM